MQIWQLFALYDIAWLRNTLCLGPQSYACRVCIAVSLYHAQMQCIQFLLHASSLSQLREVIQLWI